MGRLTSCPPPPRRATLPCLLPRRGALCCLRRRSQRKNEQTTAKFEELRRLLIFSSSALSSSAALEQPLDFLGFSAIITTSREEKTMKLPAPALPTKKSLFVIVADPNGNSSSVVPNASGVKQGSKEEIEHLRMLGWDIVASRDAPPSRIAPSTSPDPLGELIFSSLDSMGASRGR